VACPPEYLEINFWRGEFHKLINFNFFKGISQTITPQRAFASQKIKFMLVWCGGQIKNFKIKK